MLNLRVSYATWTEAVRAIVTQLLNMFGVSHTWTGVQVFSGGFSVGGGPAIDKIITNTATLNYASIASNATATLTITVTGAVVGDMVIITPPSTLEDGLIYCGGVTVADTVCIRVHNTSGGAIDPASATWRATAISWA